MALSRFNWLDVIFSTISLCTLVLDVITDVVVVMQFYRHGHTLWAMLAAGFVVVPFAVMNIISIKWKRADRSLSRLSVLMHASLLAPIQRYICVLWLGVRCCRFGHPRFTDAALHEQNDVSILRLFQVFLESAPQLVLQASIMWLAPDDLTYQQVLSLVTSLLSLSWALASYCDTSRLTYQSTYQKRCFGMVVNMMCHLFLSASRVAALVAFISVFKAWVLLAAGVHWMVVTLYIQGVVTDVGKDKVRPATFHIMSGFIYIFIYLNVHRGPTRRRIAVYYGVVCSENLAAFILWMVFGAPLLLTKVLMCVLIFGAFFLGLVFLTLYYGCFHPSLPSFIYSAEAPTSDASPAIRTPTGKEITTSTVYSPTVSSPTASIMQGSTLELSIESGTPCKVTLNEDTNNSHFKPASQINSQACSVEALTACKGALVAAWQSGVQSSSSSTSSLDVDDCSLDDFNTTSKSACSAFMENYPSKIPPTSQTDLNTIAPITDSCTGLRGVAPVDKEPFQATSYNMPSHLSLCSSVSVAGEFHDPSSVTCVHENEDATKKAFNSCIRSYGNCSNQRSKAGDCLEEGLPAVSVIASRNSDTCRKQLPREMMEGGSPAFHHSLYSLSVHQQKTADHLIFHSQTNYDSSSVRLSHIRNSASIPCSRNVFQLEDIPPNTSERLMPCSSGISSQDRQCSYSDHETLADIPEGTPTDYLSPESKQLYADDEGGYVGRQGGESMWGVSPDTSNSSSKDAGNTVSLQEGRCPVPQLVDSFEIDQDDTSFGCTHTQDAVIVGDRNQSTLLKNSEKPCVEKVKHNPQTMTSFPPHPASCTDEPDTSWASMCVNEDEVSGLNNLTNLTSDDSYNSNDGNETIKADVANGSIMRESVASRCLSTPSLLRSRSTSSLFHDFISAGVSPSPPPGLKLSPHNNNNNNSNVDMLLHRLFLRRAHISPSYIDPLLPPHSRSVEDRLLLRHDPREVIIEMLMNELQHSGAQSQACLNNTYHGVPSDHAHPLKSSYKTGYGSKSFDMQHPQVYDALDYQNVPSLRNVSSYGESNSPCKGDIDLMREALDLIEMQRSPQVSGREHAADVYVNGQYRPPILSNDGVGAPSCNTSHLDVINAGARCPPASRSVSDGVPPSQAEYNPNKSYSRQPSGSVRRQSRDRGGLHRYFLESNSPNHSTVWNTPLKTAMESPHYAHLLQLYLPDDPVRSVPSDGSGQAQCVPQPLDNTSSDGVLLPGNRSYVALHNLADSSMVKVYVDDATGRGVQNSPYRQPPDQIDSGVHSGSLSASSKRQPLQSLDNSPSISPSTSVLSIDKRSTAKRKSHHRQASSHLANDRRKPPSSESAKYQQAGVPQTDFQQSFTCHNNQVGGETAVDQTHILSGRSHSRARPYSGKASTKCLHQ